MEKVKQAEQVKRERPAERVPIQGHYVRGETVLHEKASEHRTQLKLSEFVATEPAHPEPVPPDAVVQDRGWLSRVKRRFVKSSDRTDTGV